MNDVITQQWGAFGAVFLLILGPLAAFALLQTRALADAQKARVDDAKEVTETTISVLKDVGETTREQVRSQAEAVAASDSVADALKRVEDRIGALEVAMGKIISGGATEPRRPR